MNKDFNNDLLVINSKIKQIQEFIRKHNGIHTNSISEILVVLEKKKKDMLKEIKNEKISKSILNHALEIAYKNKNYKIAQFLEILGAEYTNEKCDLILIASDKSDYALKKLKEEIQKGRTISERIEAVKSASYHGCLKNLKYLLYCDVHPNTGIPDFLDHAVNAAIEGNNLNIIKYLDRTFSLEAEKYFYKSIASNRLKIVQYFINLLSEA